MNTTILAALNTKFPQWTFDFVYYQYSSSVNSIVDEIHEQARRLGIDHIHAERQALRYALIQEANKPWFKIIT